MQTKTNVIYGITVLFLGIFFLASCSAEDGETGPAGPAGPQGEQGAQGTQGDQGEQGVPGTANVIYSDWIPIDFPATALLQKIVTLASEEEITNLDVDLETSTVLVYGRGDVLIFNGIEVFPLPFATGANIRYTYTIDGGEINLVGLAPSGENNDFDLFDDYRYVIIPGGQPIPEEGEGAEEAAKGLDYDYSKMSYEEIADLFNIED